MIWYALEREERIAQCQSPVRAAACAAGAGRAHARHDAVLLAHWVGFLGVHVAHEVSETSAECAPTCPCICHSFRSRFVRVGASLGRRRIPPKCHCTHQVGVILGDPQTHQLPTNTGCMCELCAWPVRKGGSGEGKCSTGTCPPRTWRPSAAVCLWRIGIGRLGFSTRNNQ
jgi:hypothetical protein